MILEVRYNPNTTRSDSDKKTHHFILCVNLLRSDIYFPTNDVVCDRNVRLTFHVYQIDLANIVRYHWWRKKNSPV